MRIVFHGTNAASFSDRFATILGEDAEIALLPDMLATETDREIYRQADAIIGVTFNDALPIPTDLRLFHVPGAGYDAVAHRRSLDQHRERRGRSGQGSSAVIREEVQNQVYVSAYFAEIWRGSIEAVPFQQWEASAALALKVPQQYRYIILPQAIRISLAPSVGFLVQLVKNTSIVSVVGFVDLARAGQLINNATFKPFQIFGVVATFYFLICFPLSRFSRHLEKKLNANRSY